MLAGALAGSFVFTLSSLDVWVLTGEQTAYPLTSPGGISIWGYFI